MSKQFINDICKPWQRLGLTAFTHDITFGNGEISIIADEKITQFYRQNKVPAICTDAFGRTLPDGIYINKVLKDSYEECAVLLPLLVNLGNKYGLNYGKSSLHIVLREIDCQHLYSLFFDLDENAFLHSILNNGNFIPDFIAQYNVSGHDLILKAKANENRITLPTSKDFYSDYCHGEILGNKFQIKIMHNQLNLPIYLTPQQSRCLLLLAEGKPAKKIALELKLSHRTVEHYLEKIRKQLGCSSNKELIAIYGNQLAEHMYHF